MCVKEITEWLIEKHAAEFLSHVHQIIVVLLTD